MKNVGGKAFCRKKENIYINTNLYKNIRNDIKPESYSFYSPNSYRNKTNLENSKFEDTTVPEYTNEKYYSLRNNNSFIKTSYIQNYTKCLKLLQTKKNMKKNKIMNKITYKVAERLLSESCIVNDKYNNNIFPNDTNSCKYNDNKNSDNYCICYNSKKINTIKTIFNLYMKNISRSLCNNNINNIFNL